MAIKLFLNSQAIMNHVFPLMSKNAYDATEVDKFLDIVIGDYTEYDRWIAKYKNELRELMEENKELKNEIRNLKSTLSIAENNKGVTNVDILRRLSELEKVVYKD